MATVLKQRDIVDVPVLREAIDAQFDESTPTKEVRHALFLMIKQALEEGKAEIRQRFEAGGKNGGDEAVHAQAFLMDQLLKFAIEVTTERVYPTANPTQAERICAVAIGGYGRGELAPFSDIDLLFLMPYKITPRIEQIVESILYLLWDLGLKVGHATRSMDDCIRLAKQDITIRTSILEARLLWGNQALFAEMRQRFWDEIARDTGPGFVDAKLAERDQRHQRMGDSRYVLEPNVKDGKGGLRDLQTLFWIGKYIYRVESVADLVEKGVLTAREAAGFARAEGFLRAVRCHLHYLTGRGEDRLTFDMQREIGERLEYRDRAGTSGVERFMKHYYLTVKTVGDLTRIFCAALEAEQRRPTRLSRIGFDFFRRDLDGYPLEAGRVSIKSGSELAKNPVRILELFRVAQKHDLDVHPRALRLITRHIRLIDQIRDDADANRLFLEMLTDKKGAEITLRRLNEAGVFGRFLPDFGRVVAQMQHDMYHVYTVDEHTIFAIGILHGIEAGRNKDDMPVATEAMHKISSRRALMVATFLHDIAKGRGGDHSVLGAEVADALCPRLGLSEEETETVSWLVRHHLMMSRIAFHRDLIDPKSITDFAEQVQSLERLRLLLLLTVVDIRAVGPNVWNNWKASLLRELYYATEAVLSGGHDTTGRERRIGGFKQAAREALTGWSEAEIEHFLELGYPSYWLSLDTGTHVRHAGFIRRAEAAQDAISFDTRIDRSNGVTELTIYTADHPGLFSSIAGAMALSGANIVDAKIFTMTNGMALDIFSIQDSGAGAYAEKPALTRLCKRIEDTLTGRLKPYRELAKKPAIAIRARAFNVALRVLINNTASRTHSVIEINGRDRPGLLYKITHVLTQLGLQISSALITTYGERAVDVFYVKDTFGMQITHEGKLEQIRMALRTSLEDDGAGPVVIPHSEDSARAKRARRVAR